MKVPPESTPMRQALLVVPNSLFLSSQLARAGNLGHAGGFTVRAMRCRSLFNL